jgi:hypothetical protein
LSARNQLTLARAPPPVSRIRVPLLPFFLDQVER